MLIHGNSNDCESMGGERCPSLLIREGNLNFLEEKIRYLGISINNASFGIPSKSIFAYHDIHGRYDIDIVSIFHFTV